MLYNLWNIQYNIETYRKCRNVSCLCHLLLSPWDIKIKSEYKPLWYILTFVLGFKYVCMLVHTYKNKKVVLCTIYVKYVFHLFFCIWFCFNWCPWIANFKVLCVSVCRCIFVCKRYQGITCQRLRHSVGLS